MSIARLLLSPHGRIRRRDYWLWSVGSMLFWLAVLYVSYYVLRRPGLTLLQAMKGWMEAPRTPFHAVLWSVYLIRAWPEICIVVKRWHDRNRTGYIGGLAYIAMQGGNVIIPHFYPERPSGLDVKSVFYIAVLVFWLWQFIECGCLDGTRGRNRYGPSPKSVGEEAAVF